jgi:hypothetical protein
MDTPRVVSSLQTASDKSYSIGTPDPLRCEITPAYQLARDQLPIDFWSIVG